MCVDTKDVVILRKDTDVTYSPGTPNKFTAKRHNVILRKRKDKIELNIRNDGYDANGQRKSILNGCSLTKEETQYLIEQLQGLLEEDVVKECYGCSHFTHTRQGWHTVGYCKLKSTTTDDKDVCEKFKARPNRKVS